MKSTMAGVFALAALAGRAAAEAPIGKVLSMLSELQAKVVAEGEVVQKEYAEFAEWCEDRARNLEHEIKTGKAEAAMSEAWIPTERFGFGMHARTHTYMFVPRVVLVFSTCPLNGVLRAARAGRTSRSLPWPPSSLPVCSFVSIVGLLLFRLQRGT